MVSIRNDPTGAPADDRWNGRPVLSALVSVAVFVIPIALSIVSATIAAHVLPRPHGTGWTVGWWALVLAVPTLVLVVTDRLARHAMPLAVLLKMTMVFPDRAPKRLAVARKAGNTRDLARRVEEAKIHGIEDEPVLAAEKILALAGALNAHDKLTRGHGERVRAFTDLIADELDLPTEDRDRLRWSALLHDIGKLAVHPHILNKPDKLDDEEWVVMKNHPLEGAKLTAPLAGWLGPWANTIAEHHEKYDGSGYPYGLAGEEISLGGRVVAVADCYDTMTATRSYKRAMSAEAARTELAACAGAHFDPRVVRAFLDVSIGRLRPVAGPLAWLGSLPFVSSVPRLGQVASALGRVGAATAVVGGAVTIGTVTSTSEATALRHGVQVASPISTGAQPTRTEGSSQDPQGNGSKAGQSAGTSSGSNTALTGSSTGSTVAGQRSGSGSSGSGSGGFESSGSGSSGAGSDPTTIPGTPLAAPSAPTAVNAVAGNGQVTVSWSVPSNGGSPVTSYTVTPYVGGAAQAARTFGSTTTGVVTGLSNGTT
jgi:putative nucleotidyltransferase with HDIG domain